MRSSPTAPTGRRAEPAPPPIFRPLATSDGARGQDGFTLLEMVCVVPIIAMLAAILLPSMPRGTSRPRLEAYALETAALLKADRTAAIAATRRGRRRRSTRPARSIRSGSTGRIVQVPDDVALRRRYCR